MTENQHGGRRPAHNRAGRVGTVWDGIEPAHAQMTVVIEMTDQNTFELHMVERRNASAFGHTTTFDPASAADADNPAASCLRAAMTDMNHLLAHNCFTMSGGAEDATWYSNGVHHLLLYDDGRWLIVDAEAPDRLVSEGRGVKELAAKVVHPRWIDGRGFVVRDGKH